MELRGRSVRFAIRDIYFPGPEAVLHELHGRDLLSGRIIDVSDSGADLDAFVVVKVEGLDSPVVVAANRIHEQTNGTPQPAGAEPPEKRVRQADSNGG